MKEGNVMAQLLVRIFLVFALSKAAYSHDYIAMFSFEGEALNRLGLYQGDDFLGYPGDLVTIRLPKDRWNAGSENESDMERPVARIYLGSRTVGDYGIVDFDYHFLLEKNANDFSFKAIDGRGSCFTNAVKITSNPEVSVRQDSNGVLRVNVGKFGVRAEATGYSCMVTPVDRTIKYQSVELVSEPSGANIYFGENATEYTTPSVVRVPLELVGYENPEDEPDQKATLAILLSKSGYVNRRVVVSEGDRRVNVVLEAPMASQSPTAPDLQ
jgi:hypothetical protein